MQVDLDAEVTSDDPRVEFIQDIATNKLKVKTDKWKKALSQDENKALFQRFFNLPRVIFLVFSAPVSGDYYNIYRLLRSYFITIFQE